MAFEERGLIYNTCVTMIIVSVLYITANSLPAWLITTNKLTSVKTGLWKICISKGGTSVCNGSLMKVSDECRVIRIFITICCILCPLVAIVTLLIVFVNEKCQKTMSILSKSLSMISFICGIIGVVIGVSSIIEMTNENEGRMGAACVVAIVAVVLHLFGGVQSFLIR